MIPQTIGRKYDIGRIARIRCVKNDTLKDIDIKGNCFLLLLVYEGLVRFRVDNQSFDAVGPCFVCFDERENPKIIKKRGLKCDAIYFHPTFLNININFENIRGSNYNQLALSHDLFLMKPFTDAEKFVCPIFEGNIDSVQGYFNCLDNELNEQSDWYWSCRSRSYFMEIILILERTYGIFWQGYSGTSINRIINPHLKDAVIYIESHYQESVSLESIRDAASINHNTLTHLFKQELNTTPIEYLWHYRMIVAKKLLRFTNLPLKEIYVRCGFKTIQHFDRKFNEYTGVTPSAFRKTAIIERKAAFG